MRVGREGGGDRGRTARLGHHLGVREDHTTAVSNRRSSTVHDTVDESPDVREVQVAWPHGIRPSAMLWVEASVRTAPASIEAFIDAAPDGSTPTTCASASIA